MVDSEHHACRFFQGIEDSMESLVIDLENLRIHYLMWGKDNKEAMICLHGTSGNSYQWTRLAEHFEDRYKVLSLDQRGHGDSDKPERGYAVGDYEADLFAFCDQIGLEEYILIGNSLGSRVFLPACSQSSGPSQGFSAC